MIFPPPHSIIKHQKYIICSCHQYAVLERLIAEKLKNKEIESELHSLPTLTAIFEFSHLFQKVLKSEDEN